MILHSLALEISFILVTSLQISISAYIFGILFGLCSPVWFDLD